MSSSSVRAPFYLIFSGSFLEIEDWKLAIDLDIFLVPDFPESVFFPQGRNPSVFIW